MNVLKVISLVALMAGAGSHSYAQEKPRVKVELDPDRMTYSACLHVGSEPIIYSLTEFYRPCEDCSFIGATAFVENEAGEAVGEPYGFNYNSYVGDVWEDLAWRPVESVANMIICTEPEAIRNVTRFLASIYQSPVSQWSRIRIRFSAFVGKTLDFEQQESVDGYSEWYELTPAMRELLEYPPRDPPEDDGSSGPRQDAGGETS